MTADQATIPERDLKHPPKARLCLRVGVVGHRPKDLPETGTGPLEARLSAVLRTMQTEMDTVFVNNGDVFAPYTDEPGKEQATCIRLISSLAEGADRLAVEAGRAVKADLQSILPFPREDFETDFETPASKAAFREMLASATAVYELPGTRETDAKRDISYRTAGILTLRQSDLVLAVWNGEPGKLGGTGDMVAEAASAGIPIIWVDPDGDFVNLIEGKEGRREVAETIQERAIEIKDGCLEKVVRELIEPPQPYHPSFFQRLGAYFRAMVSKKPEYEKDDHPTSGKAWERLERFYEEDESNFLGFAILHRIFSLIFGLVRMPLTWSLPPFHKTTAGYWTPYYKALKDHQVAPPAGVQEHLETRFSWADNLAIRYAEIYRSAFVAVYVLAASAVTLSVISVLGHKEWKPYFVLGELAAILGIVALWLRDHQRDWHQRFLDYRQLAEYLRHVRVTPLIAGRTSEVAVQPLNLDIRPGPRWVTWYYRATLREVSLINGLAPAKLAETAMVVSLASNLNDQIAYHEKTARRQHRLNFSLEMLGYALFGSTFIVGVWFVHDVISICGFLCLDCFRAILDPSDAQTVFVTCDGTPITKAVRESLKQDMQWITFLGAALPAIGVALRSIRVHGEYRENAERSEVTARQLRKIRDDAQKAADSDDWRGVLDNLERAIQIMTDEVSVWRFVYRTKHLELPE